MTSGKDFAGHPVSDLAQRDGDLVLGEKPAPKLRRFPRWASLHWSVPV